MGIEYLEIRTTKEIEAVLTAVFECPGPVLTHVRVDAGDRPMRWLRAAGRRFARQLSARQKLRFLARMGTRSLNRAPNND
jgi:acetolactate synthase-1/2/3 large subunit